MTYEKLINNINNEKTGIAKGYSLRFLQNECCYMRNSEIIFNNIIKKDIELFQQIEKQLLKKKVPKEGDFVEYDGNIARISRKKSDGTIQLSNKIGVSVFKDGETISSGCTWDSDIDIEEERLKSDNLTFKLETKKGRCWTFSNERFEANRGVYYEINFKVWVLG